MPLASADPVGGVIITDWYHDPAATNERVKVNLIISGLELRADALRVNLFRETLRGGKWVATASSSRAARQLENIVLRLLAECWMCLHNFCRVGFRPVGAGKGRS